MMTKLHVGYVNEIDHKGSRTIEVGGTEIALFRLSDGDILAVENKCPHKGGKLSEGMVCGKQVHCPRMIGRSIYARAGSRAGYG